MEIHTKFPSTLMGMNVTIDTDGRSADITSGDVLTFPDDQDKDTSLKKVVSSDVNKFKAEQLADVALQKVWSLAKVNKGHFSVKNDLLHHHDTVLGQPVEQLCLPHSRVAEICRVAHDICHQGIKRTKEKIRSHSFGTT